MSEPVIIETLELGGLPVARLDRRRTAALLIELARSRRGDRPWIGTSVNGQVISDAARDESLREAMLYADVISCDGQPLVMMARRLTGLALPERVATTDLFHDIARACEERPASMFFLGATEEENRKAVENVQRDYPHLRIAGRLHGFHDHAEWVRHVRRINEIGPDILWLSLGVPREQQFYMRFAHVLTGVGLIKTSGGLFNFLSGSAPRAPRWMQDAGLEWAHRMARDPGRLARRYLTSNPVAAMLLLTRSKRGQTARTLSAGQP
ncbi:MAG: WecB/TagA/CpsF family glycosyltransferase [Flavobacteriaceae bacterium]